MLYTSGKKKSSTTGLRTWQENSEIILPYNLEYVKIVKYSSSYIKIHDAFWALSVTPQIVTQCPEYLLDGNMIMLVQIHLEIIIFLRWYNPHWLSGSHKRIKSWIYIGFYLNYPTYSPQEKFDFKPQFESELNSKSNSLLFRKFSVLFRTTLIRRE